jgi:hypothetical protein
MEPVVKRWQPHIDLHRLGAAAEREILAAPDEEVRQAARACGLSAARTAMEIRSMIAARTGEPDEPDGTLPLAETAKRDLHWARQH